jgi:hypothetical protein
MGGLFLSIVTRHSQQIILALRLGLGTVRFRVLSSLFDLLPDFGGSRRGKLLHKVPDVNQNAVCLIRIIVFSKVRHMVSPSILEIPKLNRHI